MSIVNDKPEIYTVSAHINGKYRCWFSLDLADARFMAGRITRECSDQGMEAKHVRIARFAGEWVT